MSMTSIVYQGLTQILAQILTIPTMPIFWIMVLLLAIQIGITYKKKQAQIVTKLSAFLFAIMECWIVTVLSGILGGIIASGLLLLTGVAIPYEVLPYLWVLMICLFFIEQRFICFAYAGGILVQFAAPDFPVSTLFRRKAGKCGSYFFRGSADLALLLRQIEQGDVMRPGCGIYGGPDAFFRIPPDLPGGKTAAVQTQQFFILQQLQSLLIQLGQLRAQHQRRMEHTPQA